MAKTLNILVVEDDEDDFFLTKELLNDVQANVELEWAPGYDEAIALINQRIHDVYLIDYRLVQRSGIEVLQYIIAKGISSPAIILTGKGDPKIDLEAMQSGAAEYLIKGSFDAITLERTIRYATEQADLVRRLRENEKKYRNIFERSRDIIFIMDKEGKIIDINSATQNTLGYSNAEILEFGKKSFFSSPHDYEFMMESLMEEREIFNREISFVTKSGSRIPCILNTTLLDKERGIFMGICHDISERKKIEETQRSADKFIASGKIARMLAHEVRNPLTNINLAVEQLRTPDTEEEEKKVFLDLIDRNSDRINNLISQMLLSTKFSELGIKPYSINNLLEESLTEAEDRIQLKKIRIQKHFDTDICDIQIDPEKMKIAFLNIIINAVEAIDHSNGIIRITTEKNDEKCIITISDNGSGIRQEDMDQLFVPFYTNKSNGTGLGLTTAQNIILNHKGTIRVESEINKGTSFTISLNLNSNGL